jgi:hypothetical protein
MWRAYLAALAATSCWAFPALADDASMEIGVLTCALGETAQASAGEVPAEERSRDALCTFRTRMGMEETYAGSVQGVSISADRRETLIWVVRAASGVAEPGTLQQVFVADTKRPADQKSPLIGEGNADIALYSLADESEGSASAADRPSATGFVILRVEFKLKSTSG